MFLLYLLASYEADGEILNLEEETEKQVLVQHWHLTGNNTIAKTNTIMQQVTSKATNTSIHKYHLRTDHLRTVQRV